MTEMSTSSVGAIGKSCDQTASIDRLFDRIESGEASLTGDGSFERVLLDELKQSSDKLGLGFHQFPGDIQTETPWGPIATAALGIVDGGRDVQGNAFDRDAARQRNIDQSACEIDGLTQADWVNYAELHPQKAAFEAGVFSTLQADVYNPGGQPQDCSNSAGTSWTTEADTGLADDLKAGSINAAPFYDLPMNHVFFNGDGRPIFLSSVMDDLNMSPATGGGQIILPDGAVLAYNP
ncbi:MAG: hypothetical protein ACR2QH_15000 [Geminicoccaceae bacterium]